jgi:hypothetical protein
MATPMSDIKAPNRDANVSRDAPAAADVAV